MASLVGPLPTRGPWTAVGLTRGQFLAVLGLSIACFALLGGPVWGHAHGEHFARIGVSYALIPVAVAWIVRRERPFPVGRWLAASAVIALVKLVATALLLVLVALAR
jgi:hypothetical protein